MKCMRTLPYAHHRTNLFGQRSFHSEVGWSTTVFRICLIPRLRDPRHFPKPRCQTFLRINFRLKKTWLAASFQPRSDKDENLQSERCSTELAGPGWILALFWEIIIAYIVLFLFRIFRITFSAQMLNGHFVLTFILKFLQFLQVLYFYFIFLQFIDQDHFVTMCPLM